MTGLIADLLEIVDDILGVRDDIGAVIHDVIIVTRTWTGDTAGEGTYSDTVALVRPSPQLVDLSHKLRTLEGGAYQQGDLILHNMSKRSYPSQSDVDLSTPSESVEKFYKLNDKLYTCVNVKESYLTWDVQIRKLSNNVGYAAE